MSVDVPLAVSAQYTLSNAMSRDYSLQLPVLVVRPDYGHSRPQLDSTQRGAAVVNFNVHDIDEYGQFRQTLLISNIHYFRPATRHRSCSRLCRHTHRLQSLLLSPTICQPPWV
jgi:hypothetical protein